MKLAPTSVISALALGLIGAPVLAQPSGETTAVETTARLNRDQAEFARQQMADNAASQQAHDDAVQQQANYEAKQARLAQQHDEAMTQWRADVDACNAGVRSRCAPPSAQ